MKPEIKARLNEINRVFYQQSARDFSEVRSDWASELKRIVPYVHQGARVLDVGCGNGRLASLLSKTHGDICYVGIDSSRNLIEIARNMETGGKHRPVFAEADIISPDWPEALQNQVGQVTRFDLILIHAVLHHIPGRAVRARILRQARDLLAHDGKMLVSAWQFPESERMRKKIVPWQQVGMNECDLEPGDTLLTWKRGGTVLRYCHWINKQEFRDLAEEAGLRVMEMFCAGGREGNLSLFAVLAKAPR